MHVIRSLSILCLIYLQEEMKLTHHFQEVEAGSSVTVECTAAANPAPASYVWSRVSGDTWRHAGRHLRLRNVTAADSGEYRSDPSNIKQSKRSLTGLIEV